jgi:hypothetical protein
MLEFFYKVKLHLAKSSDLPPGIELEPGFSLISASSQESPETLEASLASRFPAIRAGLAKLVDPEAVVLDLSALPGMALATERNRAAIQELARWGDQQSFELLIVLGPEARNTLQPSFGSATEALLFARSPLRRLERKERSLRIRVSQLDSQKTALEAQVHALGAGAEEITRLRRETTDFRRKAARLQAWAEAEGRARPMAFQNPALHTRRQTVTELLRSVLAQEPAGRAGESPPRL